MALAIGIVLGVVLIVALRLALHRALLVKLRRDVATLNARRGKIVHQEDFYADTVRIVAFDRKLTALGM